MPRDRSRCSVTEGVVEAAAAVAQAVEEIPEWFQRFLDHRQAEVNPRRTR